MREEHIRVVVLAVLLVIIFSGLVAELQLSFGQNSGFPGVKDDFYFASGSENDIYAVARDGNVWNWNGAWWWQVTLGRVIENRIYVVDSDDIYGLSKESNGYDEVFKWNGLTWEALTSGSPIMDDFSFVSESEIYAIGLDNQVLLWNGLNWTEITSGPLGVRMHIQVVSPNKTYGIGIDQNILEWNGTQWVSLQATGKIEDYFILKSDTEIYAIDANGNFCLWNGSVWQNIAPGFQIQKRIIVNSLTELYGLGSDGMIWQFNGDQWVQITNSITCSSDETGSTYYRAKYLGGTLESPAAIVAYTDRLIIACQGVNGSVYAREWEPSQNESWDSSRNSQNSGVNDWYPLNGGTSTSPELTIENGTVAIYIEGLDGNIYSKQYLAPHEWSSSWESVQNFTFLPGPFSAAGFTVAPSSNNGYPCSVSLVKYANFTTFSSKPAWINNLIIYEMSIQEFTSPNGPGSGNLNSITQKLDYLKDLGITAILLTGYVWSDPRQFANITTQYATIDPAFINPALGSNPSDIQQTEKQFRDFIQAAHQRGIRVILDAVTHGVMSYSPLVTANSTLPPYVTSYPNQSQITPHPDWFGASTYPQEGETRDAALLPSNTSMIDFEGGYDQSDLDDWFVSVWTNWVLNYGVDGFRLDLGSSRFDLWARVKENCLKAGHEIIIMPEGETDDYPFDVGVYDFQETYWGWSVFAKTKGNISDPAYGTTIGDMKAAQEDVFPNMTQQYYTIPISTHDSPSYDLNGSFFKMGYGALFTPFIPLFMAGEEFNNTYTPVPNCTITNGWLLASQLQWNDVGNLQNFLFYEGMKKAIAIRETEPALTYFAPQASSPNVVVAENFTSSVSHTPTPYLRYVPGGNDSVLIVGNNNTSTPIEISINVPLDQVGLGNFDKFEVKDLWSGSVTIVSKQEMNSLNLTISSDNFRILKITPYYPGSPNVFSASNLTLITVIIIGLAVLFVAIAKKSILRSREEGRESK